MKKIKYIILGAGPTGLTVANRLKQLGENDFIVIEREAEAGGLCRSKNIDGAPFDIGGGHFLDVRRPHVTQFLFEFMPQSEWALFERKSVIDINGQCVSHPFESNIWQFGIEKQIEYLESIAKAGCNSEKEQPNLFKDWIRWKLGDKIAEDYMLPYNRKMFSDDLDTLGVYWLDKLPNVSFSETLRSCLEKKPYGTEPGHERFFYPKRYGYGELWLRMADAIKEQIVYNTVVEKIDFEKDIVYFDNLEAIEAEKIITTIPWTSIKQLIGVPESILESVKTLKHSSMVTAYCPNDLCTDAQWIYIPDEQVSYHRILVRHNFCESSKGYWTETRLDRFTGNEFFSYNNEYAYPLNTIDKPVQIEKILSFAQSRNIYGVGRWGEHSHYNSDLVVEKGIKLAEYLVK